MGQQTAAMRRPPDVPAVPRPPALRPQEPPGCHHRTGSSLAEVP